MNIKEMRFDELETRRAEIAEELKTADEARIDALNIELDAIEERKKEIKAEAEERAKAVEEVINEPAAPSPIIEERTNTMTSREVRSTQEYIDAYVDYVKRGYDLERLGAEARTLLTTNADSGTIAVPVYVEDKINTAWEKDSFMSRVRKTYFPGNLKVGVEAEAGPAVIHSEGGAAISEEELTIGFVDLIPEYVKKMVRVSHTAMALRGTAFLDYLYDEIEYQIMLKIKNTALQDILGQSEIAEWYDGAFTTASVIEAQGLLAGDLVDPVLITTRANAATLKAAALSANYSYDPFDGLEVIYCDAAALSTADDTVAGYIVDLDAIQLNFPEGDTPRFIFDEYTSAPSNIVRIIGRLLVADGLIKTGAAVIISGVEPDGED